MIAEPQPATLSAGPGLAGQDQSPLELLGGKGPVDGHLHFTRVQGGHALAADARHARKGRAEACPVGGGEDRFSFGHGQRVHSAVQFDANGDARFGSGRIGIWIHHARVGAPVSGNWAPGKRAGWPYSPGQAPSP